MEARLLVSKDFFKTWAISLLSLVLTAKLKVGEVKKNYKGKGYKMLGSLGANLLGDLEGKYPRQAIKETGTAEYLKQILL